MTTTTNLPTRPTGNLQETFRRAKQAHEANPASPQTIRALGWALADVLKTVSGMADASPVRLIKGLAVVSDFPMDSTDSRWRESVLWSVNRFLLRIPPAQLSLTHLADIIRRSRSFVDPGPSLVRSVWFKALLRHAPAGIDWLGLFDELGWEEGFRPEDEQPETFGEGQRVSPLAERLIQAVGKQLVQTLPLTDTQAAPWLTRLTTLMERHPDWQFLPYYHARLLQQLNQPDTAMRVFLPFARRKQHDFWVWSLLADLLADSHPDQVIACYARALTLKTPEPFLVKVRQRLATLLIGLNRWDDARAEIDRLVQTRQTQNWPIPNEVEQWLNDDQYTQANQIRSGSWYASLTTEADALLWADLPEQIVLVTGVDGSGHYCNIAIDAHTTGSFPCGKFGLKPAVGNCLAIRYDLQLKNNRPHVHILTAVPVSAPCTHLHPRTITGPLRVMTGKTIGFVTDVYVPAELLSTQQSLADQLVTVDAIESWDGVKKKAGWRAYRITRTS